MKDKIERGITIKRWGKEFEDNRKVKGCWKKVCDKEDFDNGQDPLMRSTASIFMQSFLKLIFLNHRYAKKKNLLATLY